MSTLGLCATQDLDLTMRALEIKRPLIRKPWNGPPWFHTQLRMKVVGLRRYAPYTKALFNFRFEEVDPTWKLRVGETLRDHFENAVHMAGRDMIDSR